MSATGTPTDTPSPSVTGRLRRLTPTESRTPASTLPARTISSTPASACPTPTAAQDGELTDTTAIPPESSRTPPASTSAPSEKQTATPTPPQPTTIPPTPTPTPSAPALAPTPEPSPTDEEPTEPPATTEPVPPSVSVWEQDITLQTYGWHDALVPTTPDDPVYPYPRLDFDAVTPPEPRSYRAVVMQNQYVRLLVVPELGGRILRWTDRVTGRQLFYANPVIKPTRWGYRGWWLATGGIEWAFPTDEHGLNEYRPWQAQLLSNGIRVWDTDDQTGMTVEVTVQLQRASSAVTIAPRVTNPTGQAQSFQFWANAMLTLSDANRPSPALTFVLPDDWVTVHATADGSLPGPGQAMSWPVHRGRDFSRYEEWHRYLGIFADPAQAGFFGAYDLKSDQGLVRVFPHRVATGAKIFCLGDLSSSLWTDDGSRYVELWGGLTPTFWDQATLGPGSSIGWAETWYAVSGIGGYQWANEAAAIRLTPLGDAAQVALVTTRPVDGAVVLRRGGVDVERWTGHVAPDRPFHASGGASGAGAWGVQLVEDGRVIAHMGP